MRCRPIPAERMRGIQEEAEQFVGMMYELWDESRGGSLDAEAFDRAAHQHPLLVQARRFTARVARSAQLSSSPARAARRTGSLAHLIRKPHSLPSPN